MSGKAVPTVYYSDSRHTRQVGDEIAAQLGTVPERVAAPGARRRFFGAVKRSFAAVVGRPVMISRPRLHPAEFNLVIVGPPL